MVLPQLIQLIILAHKLGNVIGLVVGVYYMCVCVKIYYPMKKESYLPKIIAIDFFFK